MKTRKRRPEPIGKRLLLIIPIATASLLFGWLVVKIALVSTFSQRAPIAARFAADHPDVAFRLATWEYASGGGRVSDATYRRAMRAFGREPLAAVPFFLTGGRQFEGKNPAEAVPLLEEARRRNPRDRSTRLLLVDRYLRLGRIQEASNEIAVLARLISSARELLTAQLASLTIDPKTRRAVYRALASDPLVNEVLVQLAQQDADPDIVLGLAQARKIRPAKGADTPWQQLLVESQVRRDNIGRARTLWTKFNPSALSQSGSFIHNPEFGAERGTPPFNWAFGENDTGTAEPAPDGGLLIEYFGRNSGPLASELLTLSPGTYRIGFQADGDANGRGSRLALRISCRTAASLLLELPIVGVQSTPRNYQGAFAVPPTGCASQWLRFEGISGEFPTTQSAHVRELKLQPAGTP